MPKNIEKLLKLKSKLIKIQKNLKSIKFEIMEMIEKNLQELDNSIRKVQDLIESSLIAIDVIFFCVILLKKLSKNL